MGYGFNSYNLNSNEIGYKVGLSPFYYAFILIPIIAFLGIIVSSKLNNKSILEIASD